MFPCQLFDVLNAMRISSRGTQPIPIFVLSFDGKSEEPARANDAGAAYALIIGDVELDSGEVQLKNLVTGEQRTVGFDMVAEALRS